MKSVLLILLLCLPIAAQHTFNITDASKYFDVKVKVAKCEDTTCSGKASFSFYKKGGAAPYQVINMADTILELGEGGKPSVNVTMLYDQQSVINVDDFNFDGMEDVAICNGQNGSYGMPSYDIYISSRSAGKFVYSKAISALGVHLGMPTVNKDKKTLSIFDKSGCCWHVTMDYKVVKNRPIKIFEEVEDATMSDGALADKVKITTKRLVNGKWKTTVKYVKREE